MTAVDDLSTGQFENIEPLVERWPSRGEGPAFNFVIDSIANQVVLDRLVSGCDVIFHLAAAVGVHLIVENPVHVIETNITGTEMVLRTALRYRAKVLIASTSEVYGKGNKIPFQEDDDVVLGPTCRNRWAYAASKMVDEFLGLAYCRQKGLPVVVFRLFNTVGPRQRGRYGMVVPRFMQQALRGEALTVYGDGHQSRCFLHVHDAVEALVALASCPEAIGQVFNVGSTQEISIVNLASKVLSMVDGHREKKKGKEAEQQFEPSDQRDRIALIPYDQAYARGFEDMRRRVPDISKISRYTGWEPNCSLEGILSDVLLNFTSRGTSTRVDSSPLPAEG